MKGIVVQTIEFVKKELEQAESGHDWFHIERVWKMAKRLAAEEDHVNALVVELAALLHDIADAKFHNGNEDIGPTKARDFLSSIEVEDMVVNHVENIIRNMSFKTQLGEVCFSSLEMDVVQDADRLDAMGAIGIARTFNYGGFKNRPIYDPAVSPKLNQSKEEYKNSTAPTINHFYEKLLLLKDKMNTETGRALAKERHQFMLQYLQQFYSEWEGVK
ncbi:HD domain-containing protein [Pseudopedobacter beijingensis]|uniref:HD domain-containing protein n=1 Tax=Pseudopedobacter beijingensis TaxID=1207056 RepID=A0ABW4ICC5_9SPHI